MPISSSTAPMSPPSSSPIAADTVSKAVDALLKWMSSQRKKQKAQLLETDELIYLILTLKKVPAAGRTNPFKIRLPHAVRATDGSHEMCLFIDDRTRPGKGSLTSRQAKEKIEAESIPVAKVIKLSKLKTDYRSFEAKRQLCGSYDFFFADKRVISLLPRLIGRQFFKKKKIPVPIDLTKSNWKEQIENVCSSGLLYLRTGTCSIVKVGRASQGRDELVENVAAAIDGVAEVVPKKWAGIRSFHLKSLESVALPIYQSVPDLALKIEGYKKVVDEVQVKGGLEKVKGKVGDDSQKESSEKKVKKMSKRGRIHEVHYMDDDITQLMADVADDDEKEKISSEVENVHTGKGTKKKISEDIVEAKKKMKKGKKARTLEDDEEVSASEKAKKRSGQDEGGKLKKKKRQT